MSVVRWWAPWALPVSASPVRDALITIDTDAGIVADVTAHVSRDTAEQHGAELLDGCTIAPGFVNAHCHLEYALYEGIADGLPFGGWIRDHVQRKRRLGAEHMLASARVGAWESVAGGITTVLDASYSGDAARAMDEVGLRGRVYLEVFGTTREQHQLDDVIGRLAQLPSSDLVELGISPHAPYTVSRELYRLVAGTGLPWTTHLLESPDERACVRDARGPLADAVGAMVGWGEGPVTALRDVLGAHVVAAHLVQADGADLDVLAETEVLVAHCPRSNARLGCGVLDLDALDRAGVHVALGTDSPSTAGPIDMFAEMRAAIELHRAVRRSADSPSAARMLEMATRDGARAVTAPGLGTIAAGSPADLVACEVDPAPDPTAAYVLAGSPARIRVVLVAGREAWRRGRTSLQDARNEGQDARTLLSLPLARDAAST